MTGAGHPGYPGDSALFERNDIYSNNFNPYDPGGDVIASFPFPVGTGAWIAGGNNHTVRNNRIWDNWRRGTMLFAVPDSLICGPAADGNMQAGCEPGSFSTSHNNRYYGNLMGIAPDGSAAPNGLDFWWDSFPGNSGNCWYDNTGAAPITTSPDPLPDCDGGTNPDSSVGTGNSANEGELVTCFVAFETDNFDPESSPCPWFDSPPKPGAPARARPRRPSSERASERRSPTSAEKARLRHASPSTLADRLRARAAVVHGVGRGARRGRRLRARAAGPPAPLQRLAEADPSGRREIVGSLRAFLGGPVIGEGVSGRGTVLEDEQAYRLFNGRCERFPGFLLYKLYSHAAAFAGGLPRRGRRRRPLDRLRESKR